MARSREYWEERFADLEEAQSERGAEYFAELEKQYKRASASVQRDIERWYARFADNNEISIQETRKLLSGNDLEELRWNVMDYIEKGRTLNISDQWARQLENASARVHISRLEAIKIQMQNHVEVLYGNEMDEFSEVMREIYTEGYYHTAYEIQKGFNIGYDLMRLDTNKVEKVLSRPWAADGSNFSDRIWKQKSQLVSELHNNLTQAIMRGQNPHAVTEAIAKRFNVSRGQAGRLVMTESAFFNSASNRDCYKDLGVEQFEILATLDKHTSDICQSLDGKVFPMSEYAIGVTAPPFHVWCRTTTVPYFDDEFELGSERTARDEDGKTYYVPSDMKYEDWKNTFVDGGSKDGLEIIGTDRVRSSAQKMKNPTIEDINTAGTDMLEENYESHRTKNGLNLTPADELGEGKEYAFGAKYGKMSVESAEIYNDTVEKLIDEYDTPLTHIRPMTQEEYASLKDSFVGVIHDYTTDSATMTLNISKLKDLENLKKRVLEHSENGFFVDILEDKAGEYVPTHEFAHTLLGMTDPLKNKTNWVGADYGRIRNARKRIEEVYEEYVEEVRKLEDELNSVETQMYDLMFEGTEELERQYDVLYEQLKDIKFFCHDARRSTSCKRI